MKGFFLLIRPLNLLIIALTMYGIRLYLSVYDTVFFDTSTPLFEHLGEPFDFFLLVLSTVMIAAAGNVINDYFDVKADRINKPERVIIGKMISRRWAIILHSLLNVFAFGIAIYLGIRYTTFWYVFIHLLSMNSLWLYSLYLKKQPLIGNFLIAGLTALVPILCGIHFYVQEGIEWKFNETNTAFTFWLQELIKDGHFISLLAFFAFVNNFAREIIKDIQDIEGDKVISAKTLPIHFGVRTAKRWAGALLLTPVLFFGLLFFWHQHNVHFPLLDQLLVFLPVLLSLNFDLIAVFLLWKSRTRNDLKFADRFVKLAMILGVLTSAYWFLLWT